MMKPRRNGRPPLGIGPSTVVTVRLCDAMYDALYAAASEHGQDVSAFIRDAIEKRLIVDRRAYPRVTVQ